MKDLARRETTPLALTPEQIDLVKRTVAAGATNDELALFLYHAEKSGLDPLARQVHFVVRGQGSNRKGSIQTGIDGYRLIADRTGKYAGNDDPVFEIEEGSTYPKRAIVTVWKIVDGQRCPFTASARWGEYYPGDGNAGFMWRKMPGLMLGKAAEALALRKAFPAELSGLLVDEEMHQADAPIDTTAKDSTSVGETAVTGSAGTSGDPVRSADRGSGASSGAPDPDPPLAGDRPCPHCGHETNETKSSNDKAPKWRCSNDSCTGNFNKPKNAHEPWVSWSTNPWKPGGEVEQLIAASSSETESAPASAAPQEPKSEVATQSNPASGSSSSHSAEGGDTEPTDEADADETGDPSPSGSELFSLLEQAWEGGIVTLSQAIRAALGACGRANIAKPPSTKAAFAELPESVLADIVEALKLEERIPA